MRFLLEMIFSNFPNPFFGAEDLIHGNFQIGLFVPHPANISMLLLTLELFRNHLRYVRIPT